MTDFLSPRLTQAQHAKALHDAMERMPGVAHPVPYGGPAYVSSGREMEAFSKVASLYAANGIPVRPEPRSQEEFNARGLALRAAAAELGLEARLIHPQDQKFLGGPIGLFQPFGGMPDTTGKLSAMEHYVARELAHRQGFEAYKADVEKREAERNQSIADYRRKQARNDPDYVESLENRLAALEAKNGATSNTGQAAADRADDPWAKHPGHWEGEVYRLDDTPENNELTEDLKAGAERAKAELPGDPESYGLEPADDSSRGFLNRFRRS